MLKGISPLLNADILHALAAMGHGDVAVIADANFPGESVARQTRLGRLLRIDGATSSEVAEAVLSLMPLDRFEKGAAACMAVVGDSNAVPQVRQEVQEIVNRAEGSEFPLLAVERFDFYERAKNAFCVIQCGERRLYGCFLLKKGVVEPEA